MLGLAGTEVPSKGVFKHCTLVSAETVVPPSLVFSCSRARKAVFSNTESKLPGSVPRATSITVFSDSDSITSSCQRRDAAPFWGEWICCPRKGWATGGLSGEEDCGFRAMGSPILHRSLGTRFFTSAQDRAGANAIQPRETAATSLSPENTHFTQNKAEGTDWKGAVPDTEAETPRWKRQVQCSGTRTRPAFQKTWRKVSWGC